MPHAAPWSPASPHLHTVAVTVGGATVAERFGLRVFGADAATGRFTLNGDTVKLVGFNHHTQWPGTGASPPVKSFAGHLIAANESAALHSYRPGCSLPLSCSAIP